jgi:RNA polymerase sigma factor FliA
MAAHRDRLVEEHLPLVRSIANKLRGRLGKTLEPGDLVAYGTQGLLEAAARYDPRHGVAFSTFAYYRIRGAMFDGMRTMGWYSRSDCARFRAEERAGEYLAAVAEREAAERASAPAETAGTATDALAAIAELLGGVAAIHITSLEAARDEPDQRQLSPDQVLLDAEWGQRVRAALRALPAKERRLLELYYWSDRNLEEVGKKLGLSKSWASRLHARAVGRLREILEGGSS